MGQNLGPSLPSSVLENRGSISVVATIDKVEEFSTEEKKPLSEFGAGRSCPYNGVG